MINMFISWYETIENKLKPLKDKQKARLYPEDLVIVKTQQHPHKQYLVLKKIVYTNFSGIYAYATNENSEPTITSYYSNLSIKIPNNHVLYTYPEEWVHELYPDDETSHEKLVTMLEEITNKSYKQIFATPTKTTS